MNDNKTTKRALGSSIVALLVCFTMLLGSTYAWFTDVVTSSGNVIKSGTLDVAFTWSDDASAAEDTWNDVEAVGAKPIFDYELWEPGYTSVRYLKVENKGTLALKYKLQIVVHNETVNGTDVKLSDVIDVYYAPSKGAVPDRDLDNNPNLTKLGTLTQFLTGAAVNDVLEKKGDADYATLVLKMQESAGNEYQNLSIGTAFDVMLFATQYTYEEDSFDHLYDEDAEFPTFGSASAPIVKDSGATTVELRDEQNTKLASTTVTCESYDGDASQIQLIITETNFEPNITIQAGNESETVDIKVLGIKEGNTANVKVEYRLPAGLDPDTVKVYHHTDDDFTDDEIFSTYNPHTGYVIFNTTSFSPFTFEYNAGSKYVDNAVIVVPDNLPAGAPTATVTESPENENVDLNWGSYGQWSPTVGLDSQLEGAFKFACDELPEIAKWNKFADWYCDFYVKLDKDLGENQIFLGGNYGSIGWVGFHNGDLTLEANTEIGLLKSVTTNPWTYKMVAQNVGTFLCGVGDVDDALAGATFTVMLRLTDPKDENNFFNVSTVEYTFDNKIYNAADLQTAVNAGGNVKLGADLDLSDESLVINTDTVLDLNGHTISGLSTSSTTSSLITVNSGAELTLTGDGIVTFEAANPDVDWDPEGFPTYANNTIKCLGKLTIDGVTVKNTTNPGGASYAIDCYQGSDLTVNSGLIDGCGKLAIRMFCNSNTLSTNVTINGGTITGKRAIWVQLPGSNINNVRPVNLTINGGDLICTNTDADVCVYSYSYGDSFAGTNITITGGNFTGDVCFGGGNAKTTQETVTVTGGTFNGELGRYLENDGWEDIAKP